MVQVSAGVKMDTGNLEIIRSRMLLFPLWSLEVCGLVPSQQATTGPLGARRAALPTPGEWKSKRIVTRTVNGQRYPVPHPVVRIGRLSKRFLLIAWMAITTRQNKQRKNRSRNTQTVQGSSMKMRD